MQRNLKHILPIASVEHDAILSKQGDVTIVYEAVLPEIFTLSNQEYEAFHQALIKAVKVLPKYTVLHKQDWFTDSTYKPQIKNETSFLSRSSEEFFEGRPCLEHRCYVMLTKKPQGRRPSTSLMSTILKRTLVPEETIRPQALQDFLDAAGQFERILQDSGFMRLKRLKEAELVGTKGSAGIIERYLTLHADSDLLLKDIEFDNGTRIGEDLCQLYTLADAEVLPSLCGSRITYDKYSSDKTRFSTGFASPLGQLLPCSHIYNQYIFIEDAQKTIQQLESKRLRLQSLSAYSRENAISRDATNNFLNEAIASQRMPVKAHFNVLVWTSDKEKLKYIKNLVSSALAQMDAIPRQETAGMAQILWAGMPGNQADFPMNDTFDTFAEQACCFLNLESNYRNSDSKTGVHIRLGDRLFGKPVQVDISDEPMQKGIITNRN
ncbi:MAG: TraG family conjugative transposon ATPase, partial [Williamsia sp.]|nr:TraG family conjugative transposon ATPase [Williamsia sp.]